MANVRQYGFGIFNRISSRHVSHRKHYSRIAGTSRTLFLCYSRTAAGEWRITRIGKYLHRSECFGEFRFSPYVRGASSSTPIKGEILNQTTIDGITAYVHNIDLDALSPGAGSISDIMREIDFTRPNEFILFESILPSGDITTIANESFTIDKIVATLRFFPFPSLGPVGSETLKMDPNEGDYHDLNDNNVYYETGKITSTQMSLTVRNSAQLKFGGQISFRWDSP